MSSPADPGRPAARGPRPGAAQHLLVQLGGSRTAARAGPKGQHHHVHGQDRCGASKNTMVRGSAASSARRRSREAGGAGTLEAEPVGGAGDHQGRAAALGPGTTSRQATLQAGGDQVVAGVGDGRHAGVADQGQAQPGGHPLSQLLGPLALADLVVAGHAGLTPRWASSLRVWRVSSQATRSAPGPGLAASARFPIGHSVRRSACLPSCPGLRLGVSACLPLELGPGEGEDRQLGRGRRVDRRVGRLLRGSSGLASDTGVP